MEDFVNSKIPFCPLSNWMDDIIFLETKQTDVTIEDIENFRKGFLARLKAEVLVNGNYEEQETLIYQQMIDKLLSNTSPLPEEEIPTIQVVKLKSEAPRVIYRRFHETPENQNHAIAYYFQLEDTTNNKSSAISFILA